MVYLPPRKALPLPFASRCSQKSTRQFPAGCFFISSKIGEDGYRHKDLATSNMSTTFMV
jgi:hypothetical protein